MKDWMFNDSSRLSKAFQRGDTKALEVYFNVFYPALCYYASSYTHDMEVAKEIASEAFVKTWKYREQFTNAGSIRAYLYKVVRGDASSWHIKKQRFPLAPIPDEEDPSLQDADEFAKLVKAETLRHLYNAIENLPAECRKIFRLLYIDGKKVAEIADELNISPSTVKAQKARGLALLRKKITLLVLSIPVLVEKIIGSL
jgi:RNA polymerase sigma-70 factor, ECF subfamily